MVWAGMSILGMQPFSAVKRDERRGAADGFLEREPLGPQHSRRNCGSGGFNIQRTAEGIISAAVSHHYRRRNYGSCGLNLHRTAEVIMAAADSISAMLQKELWRLRTPVRRLA